METTFQGLEISVALLMDDLASAKEIASALRQSNILAHHYSNLDEFWATTTLQLPDLLIIDVTKMSQGTVQFRQHPKVIDQTLSYVFYSKDSTKVLLQSTLGLKPFAYIHQDSSLNIQIMTLIEKKRDQMMKDRELSELKSRVQRLQARSQRLISDRSSAEEFKANFEFIKNFCAEVEQSSLTADYSLSLMNKLDSWDAVIGYGIYELNQSGQKLVSPEFSRKKLHPFPSLWLGAENNNGIEEFATEMANQVALDLFEVDPVAIKIYSGSKNPEILLFVSFTQERLLNFPWDVFASLLSSSLRRVKLQQQLPHYTNQFVPMWEALDNLDKMQKNNFDSDAKVLTLSLLPLMDVIKKRSQNKFYWTAFFNDFFIQLSGGLQKSTKLSLMGPWQVLFFINKENLEAETKMLQGFIKQFGFWKFFEDNTQVLTDDMMPNLQLVPASSAFYLRLFEKEIEQLKLAEENKRLMNFANKDHRRLTV
jgi:DNA-binding NarL/FixJ family response regulator